MSIEQFLSVDRLARLPQSVARPAYDRDAVTSGIFHFGPGAFHRVHQSWYVDDLLATDPRWAITAASLQTSAVRDALQPQGNLYTVAVLDEHISFRVIGALREILVAPEDVGAVLRRLAAPETHIVTITVTEKGYCLGGAGDLDTARAEIQQDLATPRSPVSLIGFLVEGLRLRRTAGLRPFTMLSCDNLVDNGVKLARAVGQFAREIDPELARWIGEEGRCPRTMVDSITPFTDDALRDRVAAALGCRDRWPVQRESFVQWVIEDSFADEVPDWAAVGVTVTDDVPAYDRTKLRLLNGAHSALAYLGSLAGFSTVSQAMADRTLSAFVEKLMRVEIMPSIRAPRGLDLGAYAASLLKRFRNPTMQHALAQIAWDGSQKLPIRILGTIADNLQAGRPIERLCLPVAAWLHFVRRNALDGGKLADPMAGTLLDLGRRMQGDARHDLPAFLALDELFPATLARDAQFTTALARGYDELGVGGVADRGTVHRACAALAH
jgi:fructuronate reductase